MSRTATGTLHELVQSLTRTETRHFLAHAGEKGNKGGYLQLFRLLQKQKEFDDDVLFRESGIRRRGTYTEAKRYLRDQLMNTLVYLQQNNTAQNIQRLVTEARILSERRLHAAARQSIVKARELAEETESFPELLRCLADEEKILQQAGLFEQLYATSARHTRRRSALLKQLTVHHQYRALYHRVLVHYMRARPGDIKAIPQIAGVITESSLKKLNAYEPLLHAFSILEKKYTLGNDPKMAIAVQKKLLAIIVSYFPLPQAYHDYAVFVHNLSLELLKLKRYAELNTQLQRFREIISASPRAEKLFMNLCYYNVRLFHLIKTEQYKTMISLSKSYHRELDETLIRKAGHYQVWLMQKYWFGIAAFLTAQYRLCIRTFFEIDQTAERGVGHHLMLESQALKAIAHAELNDEANAKRLLARYMRAVAEVKPHQDTSTYLLMQGFSEYMRTGNSSAWEDAQKKIRKLTPQQQHNPFYLEKWLNAKARGR